MSGRPQLQVRVTREMLSAIDAAALTRGVDRGEHTRRMLAYALTTMPSDWGDCTAQAVNTRARQADETDAEYLNRTLGTGWQTDFTTDWSVVKSGYGG